MTSKMTHQPLKKNILNAAVIISAIGYFVDIYDLIIYNVVKKKSLADLGYVGDAFKEQEIFLFNLQMTGMLLGGLIWGILGDKKGRASVLFGSILMYSLANIANAFVPNIELYGLCRFIAGVGLAGELGAGITLVLESMDKENRGYGTMIIVTLGALGAVVASVVGQFDWKIAYIFGGVMGLLILLLRVTSLESGMFKNMKEKAVNQGNLLMLFSNRDRFFRYLGCIVIGLPVWFVVGILIALSDRFTYHIGITDGTISMANCVMFSYLGLSFGDLLSGIFSQMFRNRKKVIYGYLVANFFLIVTYLFARDISMFQFYGMCFLLGAATGYWALFVTIAAEQFGTNLRSTVANTVPNFVRGAVVLITSSFVYLERELIDTVAAALIVGVVCLILAFIGTMRVHETFGKDLDFLETDGKKHNNQDDLISADVM
jgi:putative MFS transporter